MSLAIKDRVKELTNTTGTGTLTLVSAPSGFRRFNSVLNDGDTTYYTIESGSQFEVGIGTYSANTLTRTTVLASSNSNALINITASRSFVFIVYPADKATYKDGSGRIVSGAAGIIFSDASVQTTAATTPDLSPYATLASPTFTGVPAAPTAAGGTNSTQIATTAFVASAVGSIDLSPYLTISSAASTYLTQSSATTLLAAKADLVGGLVPSAQLPSYVDDVVEVANLAAFPGTGETGKIYVAIDTGYTYRWSGSVYIRINEVDLSSYLTSSTAASTYLPLAGGTLTGDLKFTDATYDIGKSGATRPRDGWFSRTVNVGTGVTILNNNVSGNGWALLFNGTNSGIEDNQGIGTGLVLRGNVVSCYNNYIRGAWGHLDFTLGNIDQTFITLGQVGSTTTTSSKLVVRAAEGLHVRHTTLTSPALLSITETYTSTTSFGSFQIKANAGAAYQIGSAIGSAGGTNRAIDFGRWDSAGTWQSSLLIDPTNFLVTVGTTQTLLVKTLQLTSTGQIRGDSGNITLSDHSTATTFGLLRFGGTTSSYPAIKRNGVGLEFRLADDSAVAGITAGALTLTQAVATSGSPTAFTLTGAAHTTLALSTEATDVNFNLARTVQFATGALTTQRAMRIQAPTYSFVGASTITTASTLSISGPPIAGTNATITNAYALNVESGNSYFAGNVRAVGSSVYAPSYGFGSDNSGFFRSSTSRVFLGLNGNVQYDFNSGNLCTNSGSYGVAGGSVDSNSADVLWVRDGAGIWATRNGTNAQTFRLYNTYTSSTSYENLQFKANAGAAYQIGSAIGSAGGTNRDLNFGSWDTAGTFTSSFYTSSTYAGINDSKIFYVGTSSRIEFSALSSLGSPAIRFAWGGGSPACVYGGSNTLGVGINGFTRLLFGVSSTDFTGSPFTISNTAVATGAYTGFTFTGAAHTNQTASTEATMVNWNLAQTVQFATGALTTQRAMRIQAPTYSFVGASTITTASTLSISGAPVAGTNATITNAYALNVESGDVKVNGNVHCSIIALAGATPYSAISMPNNYDLSWGGFGILFGSSLSGITLNNYPMQGITNLSARDISAVNGTTATVLKAHGTWTSTTSYERINIKGKASANFEIGPENGSAGGTLRGLTIGCYPAGTSTIVGWAQFRPNASTGALEAFYLGPIADSTTTGGNARGQYSIDLTFAGNRVDAAAVASGTNSVLIGGSRGQASATNSVSIGGSTCAVTGAGAVGIGGTNATVSGTYAAVIAGELCTASSTSAFVGGGTQNTASNQGTSIVGGLNATADRYGMTARASGRFAANGDAQSVSFVLRNKTTNATATVLFLDGSSTRLTIPSGKKLTAFIIVSGVKSDGSACAEYMRKVSIKNVGGTTSLIGSVEAIGTDIEDNVLTDVTITADNTNDALDISVTGIAAETWRWVCTVEGLEIAYGS